MGQTARLTVTAAHKPRGNANKTLDTCRQLPYTICGPAFNSVPAYADRLPVSVITSLLSGVRLGPFTTEVDLSRFFASLVGKGPTCSHGFRPERKANFWVYFASKLTGCQLASRLEPYMMVKTLARPLVIVRRHCTHILKNGPEPSVRPYDGPKKCSERKVGAGASVVEGCPRLILTFPR